MRRALLACIVSALPLSFPVFADSTAVIPFANLSSNNSPGASNMDWIGESIAATVREALGSRGVLTLEPDDIAEAYRRLQLRPLAHLTDASILKLGDSLDAEHLMHGTFFFTPSPGISAQSKGNLKIQARILDRRKMVQSPEFVESGALEDLGSLEAHLAWSALRFLIPGSAPPESQYRTLRDPAPLDARENYIRGMLASTPEQKEKYFNQAFRLDGRFGHPAFELGKLHFDRKDYRQAIDWLQKVDPSDMHYHEANFFLGLARFQTGDFPGAQTAFQLVADAVPLSEVFNNLGAVQTRRNLPQGIENLKKALDGDPNDPDYHFNLGYALFKKGDFAAAADRFRAALDRDPGDQMATLLLGRCLKKQGLTPGSTNTADARLQSLERLKTTFEERAYRQLKSLLNPTAP